MDSGGFGKAQKPPKVAKVLILFDLNVFFNMISQRFHEQVKNKTPAEIQITAEQLLREAKERDLESVPPVS